MSVCGGVGCVRPYIMSVCASVYVRACARARVCVCVCVCARARVCLCVCVSVGGCVGVSRAPDLFPGHASFPGLVFVKLSSQHHHEGRQHHRDHVE